jgi:hypothetical protein
MCFPLVFEGKKIRDHQKIKKKKEKKIFFFKETLFKISK